MKLRLRQIEVQGSSHLLLRITPGACICHCKSTRDTEWGEDQIAWRFAN
jgi:hypothetical protein